MIFLPQLCEKSEILLALNPNTQFHIAKCQSNPSIIHTQCHYCGNLLTYTRDEIKDRIRIAPRNVYGFHTFCSLKCRNTFKFMHESNTPQSDSIYLRYKKNATNSTYVPSYYIE